MRFYTNCQVLGNNILLKEVDNGQRKRYKVEYQPKLFVETKKSSKWKTLTGTSVEPLQFSDMREAREFVRTNEGVPNFKIYGNTTYQYPFIADTYPDHDLHYDMSQISIVTLDIECESEKGFPDVNDPQERINVITIKDFRHEMYHVFTFKDGLLYTDENYYKPSKNVKHYSYDNEEEMLLGFIKVWRKLDPDVVTGWNVRIFDVPYICARITLLMGEDTMKKLSVWGVVQKEIVTIKKKDHNCFNIYGLSILDYYQMYVKNVSEPRENYKLGYIAEVELGQTKVDWQAKYERMKDFYRDDFQLFVEYNIQDVHLPDLLEAKLKLIELTLSVAYLAKCNYMDVTAQVRTWDTLIFNWLYQENIVVPPKEHKSKTEKFEGAFVKEPIPGRYNWVVSFDVTSLYPSIIRALNIGPETKLTDVKHKRAFTVEQALINHEWFRGAFGDCQNDEVTLAINGVSYTKSQISFFSKMVETLFNNRKKYQGEMKAAKRELEVTTDPVKNAELKNTVAKFDIKQKSTKIMMNSLYGAFGNEFFRFYDIDNAEAVTLSGKFIIQFIERGLNKHLNNLFKTSGVDYIIAGDTDSVYVNLSPLVEHVYPDGGDPIKITRFLDKVCKEKLEKKIEELFADITCNYLNGMWIAEKPILSMKREVIADPGIWTSKKHYILKVLNSEGDNFFKCKDCGNSFSGPSEMVPCNKCKSANVERSYKLKIMGMDMVKSSMPKICRDSMKEAVKIILDGTQAELVDFIEATRKRFFASPPEVIAIPKGVHGIEKYSDDQDIYATKTPLHTKAVLMYNWCVKEKGLETKYPFISDSDKIKYVYLKLPNPIREKAVAFPAKLPPEFKLDKFVDYHEMWDLTFIRPITTILDPLGWSTETQYDMDKFFK